MSPDSPDLAGTGAHVMKYASRLLVHLAESQMLCACIYVRSTKQDVPEVFCWYCASILTETAQSFTLFLKYL